MTEVVASLQAILELQLKSNDSAKSYPRGDILNDSKSQEEDLELLLFTFSTIANATANFSLHNKLGEGGFGPVYREDENGYMSPEYALHGIFSMKSDVFSFGVLVLEIVSGKRNTGFFTQEHTNDLLGHDPIVQSKFIKDDPSSNMNLLPKWFGPSCLNFFENSLLADEDYGRADIVHCGSHHCSPIKV
ncbi:hypothetical protein L1987_39647 [Smallanthus sonchifolius]|uniref:Uncharacterized protein n=1 Tax=Smallanthus sonchifolius TaxID=185202 RepID=A0ACB9HNX9_9ASTR|nr:hypothetical protein L1987_39647 [Smallanthus sonchifolius]